MLRLGDRVRVRMRDGYAKDGTVAFAGTATVTALDVPLRDAKLVEVEGPYGRMLCAYAEVATEAAA